MIEMALGCYFLFAIVFAARFKVYASMPFLLMFCGGFFYVALLSLFQGRGGSKREGAPLGEHGNYADAGAPCVSFSDARSIKECF